MMDDFDYYKSDLESLLREAELLQTISQSMTAEDWLSEVGLTYCDALGEVQLSFNQICAAVSLFATPADQETPVAQATPVAEAASVVQAAPQDRKPLQPLRLWTLNTREESQEASKFEDEFAIRQRGRRVTWSPEVDFKSASDRKSAKAAPGHLSAQKYDENVKPSSSPISDEERVSLIPTRKYFNDRSTSEMPKITRPDNYNNENDNKSLSAKHTALEAVSERNPEADVIPIEMVLKGLNHTQLTNIIKNVIKKHPEIEKEIRKARARVDLDPLETELIHLKSKIDEALPITRLTTKMEFAAYSKVAMHLGTFKKCVVEQGKKFMQSQQWDSLIEYVFLAWSYVRATPIWENEQQNATRKQCFTSLIMFCLIALKNGSFDRDALVDIHKRLEKVSIDTEDAQACLVLVQSQMSKIFN